MLFEVKGGENMHVSHYPEMCLFTTAFDDESGGTPRKVVVAYGKDHVFDQPEKQVSEEKLEVDLDPETAELREVEITMHSSPCVGYDMGEKCDSWFSERIGYEVKLLYIGQNSRKVLGNMPPGAVGQAKSGSGSSWLGNITSTASSLLRTVTGADPEGVDQGISFADVAPYLVISTKSWENAQKRLPEGEEMDISKFRPNIVVEGAEEEYEEDYWAELEVGGVKLILTQNCARCNSLNVDYKTGKVAVGESGKILKKLNSDRRVDQGSRWSPVFGRYGFLARVPEGKEAPVVTVGDEVTVSKRNNERTRFGKSLHSPICEPTSDELEDADNAVSDRVAQSEHQMKPPGRRVASIFLLSALFT